MGQMHTNMHLTQGSDNAFGLLTVYRSARLAQLILAISSTFISVAIPCTVSIKAAPCCVLINPDLSRILSTSSPASAWEKMANGVHVCKAGANVFLTFAGSPASFAVISKLANLFACWD
jgi:hypothetical protein